MTKFVIPLLVLALVLLAGSAVYWWNQHRPVVVEVYFATSADDPATSIDDLPAAEDRIQSSSHLLLIRTHFILKPVVERPEIRSLPVIARQADPVDWLCQNLDTKTVTRRRNNSPTWVVVRLNGTKADADQLSQIIDVVVKSYVREVFNRTKMRQLLIRDALARIGAKMPAELDLKERERDSAKEAGDTELTASLSKDIETSSLLLNHVQNLFERIEMELSIPGAVLRPVGPPIVRARQ